LGDVILAAFVCLEVADLEIFGLAIICLEMICLDQVLSQFSSSFILTFRSSASLLPSPVVLVSAILIALVIGRGLGPGAIGSIFNSYFNNYFNKRDFPATGQLRPHQEPDCDREPPWRNWQQNHSTEARPLWRFECLKSSRKST